MTKPATPSAKKSSGDDRNLVAVDENYVALTFEDHLRIFWQKNGKSVMALVVVILLAIVAKGAWDYRVAQKEIAVGRDYAAATTPEQLKSFATAHSGHLLAGLARLQLADADYAAGRSTEAIYGYEDAAAAIKTGPLASRARLGLAMAKIQGGKTAEGQTALQALAADATEAKGTRVEAAYQLASLASVAGKADDVKKYSDQVMQIDPTSPWMQRALLLRASLPVAASDTTGAMPAVKMPATGK
ncbi:MAG: tetratricopeptide repeat protein [Opitutaceae bacterium]